MTLEITAGHIARSRCSGFNFHHNFLNPIAVALHDIDPYATVTPRKVHRTCAHGTLCTSYMCTPTILSPIARTYLEDFARTGNAQPVAMEI